VIEFQAKFNVNVLGLIITQIHSKKKQK